MLNWCHVYYKLKSCACHQAGLFSGVITAFTIQSLAQLRPDPQVRTNALLEIIASQLEPAPTAGSSISLPPQISSAPPETAVRLNALWFSSLACSLLAALGAVLAKQWIVEYPRGAAPSATPCERAQHRQIRFSGLTTWHFLAIVDFLPLLIQMAFLLFFVGLCDFLLSQHKLVGSVVTILCVTGFLFIISCHIAAMIFPSCPFRTPLSTSLIQVYRVVVDIATNATFGPSEGRYNLWYHPTGWRSFFIRGWKWFRYDNPERVGDIPRWAHNTPSLTEDEKLTVVNARALAWLLHWVPDEHVVVKVSSFLPTLPSSDLSTPLADALPRLCTLFQSYFVIDGDLDSLYPKIVPRQAQEEKIKTLGRAIHRIMMTSPNTSYGGRPTRVIGDIFGDAYLVFPPRDMHPDIHALVCALFTADRSYHRRYAPAVQEQLFLSLLQSRTISPWAHVMLLDSLCTYLSTRSRQLSSHFKTSSLSHLVHILRRSHRMAELSSAVGLAINLILGGTLRLGAILDDKAESLPENLYTAIGAVITESRICSQSQGELVLLDTCLTELLRTFHDFAACSEMKASFLTIRRKVLTLLCQFLSLNNSRSPAALAGAISVIDCYPDEVLPLNSRDVHQLLSQMLHQLHPGSVDNDVKSILHLIGRLVDIGIEPSGSPFPTNPGEAGIVLVDILRRTGSDQTKSAVLHALARQAGFWFREGELLISLQAAGINATIISLLSEPVSESELVLVLAIADRLALSSPLSFVQADIDLNAFDSILRRQELESYTHQRCATIMLRLIQHLPAEDRGRVLDRSQVIAFAIRSLTADNQVEQYMIEEWLEMGSIIAETHWAKLSESGFLDALQSAATAHGIVASAAWISTGHDQIP